MQRVSYNTFKELEVALLEMTLDGIFQGESLHKNFSSLVNVAFCFGYDDFDRHPDYTNSEIRGRSEPTSYDTVIKEVRAMVLECLLEGRNSFVGVIKSSILYAAAVGRASAEAEANS